MWSIFSNWQQKRKIQDMRGIQWGRMVLHFWDGGGQEIGTWGWPLRSENGPCQQPAENRAPSPVTKRNWILPTTWMILEAESVLESAEKNTVWPVPWFGSCEIHQGHLGFWPAEMWDNKWILFQAAKCVVIFFFTQEQKTNSDMLFKSSSYLDKIFIFTIFQSCLFFF